MPDISVIVPVYNRASLIPITLEAILTQTVTPFEVLVVDDGSTDETPAVLRRFGDRIRVLRVDNGGDLVARNKGLAQVSGRLVAFCDSDDLWEPGFLASAAACWDAEPRLVACFSNFRVLREGVLSDTDKFGEAPAGFWSGLRAIGRDAGVFDESAVLRLIEFQPFFPSCMIVERERFLALGGWDDDPSIDCDFATALRVASAPPLGVIRKPLVAIRKHAGNRSGETEIINVRDAEVLEHVIRTRPDLARHHGAMRVSAAQRRRAALDSAFSRRDFHAVRTLHDTVLPGYRTAKQWSKRVIAGLPHPLPRFVAGLLSR